MCSHGSVRLREEGPRPRHLKQTPPLPQRIPRAPAPETGQAARDPTLELGEPLLHAAEVRPRAPIGDVAVRSHQIDGTLSNAEPLERDAALVDERRRHRPSTSADDTSRPHPHELGRAESAARPPRPRHAAPRAQRRSHTSSVNHGPTTSRCSVVARPPTRTGASGNRSPARGPSSSDGVPSVASGPSRYSIPISDTNRNANVRSRSPPIASGTMRGISTRRSHATAALLDIARVNSPKIRSVPRSSAWPTGHRSASYVSSSVACAAPRSTSASFQPRFHASCIPVFIPCAPTGLWMCAASPTTKTRPLRGSATPGDGAAGSAPATPDRGRALLRRWRRRSRAAARRASVASPAAGDPRRCSVDTLTRRRARRHRDHAPRRRPAEWEEHRDAVAAGEGVQRVARQHRRRRRPPRRRRA